MKAGGGRNKGNTFERAVAKTIVMAFSRFGITNKDCYRTPSSGGHKYAKNEDPGDLVISRKLRMVGFNFHVECKHWKKIELWPLLSSQFDRKFEMWLKQLLSASKKTGQRPMLVFKGNGRMPVFVMLPLWAWPLKKRPLPRIITSYQDKMWYIARLDEVLKELVSHADDN